MTKFNNVRIQHKRDTAANWAKAVNFVPLAGEIVVYTDLNKIKIGDGESTINELEFSGGIGEEAIQDPNTIATIIDSSDDIDFNEFTTVGWYKCDGNAATVTNGPSEMEANNGFTLNVFEPYGETPLLRQEFYSSLTGKIYTRHETDNQTEPVEWSDWISLENLSTTSEYVNGVQDYFGSVFYLDDYMEQQGITTIDLDYLYNQEALGICGPNNYTILNAPSAVDTTQGIKFQLVRCNDEYTTQYLLDYTAKLYVRHMTQIEPVLWGDWYSPDEFNTRINTLNSTVQEVSALGYQLANEVNTLGTQVANIKAPLVATDTNGTLDKTGAEIKTALEAGRPVFIARSIGNGSIMYPVALGKEEMEYEYAIYTQGVRTEVDPEVTYDQSAQYLIIEIYVCDTLSDYMTYKDNSPK